MDTRERQIYRFADVEVDVRLGCLRRDGEERRLRPKTFQVLVYLIEHRGGVISKDDLIRDVWNDTAVVDDVLVQSVKDIRRALGDDTRRPRFVRTIPKVGYRFIAEVQSPESEVQSRVEETEDRRPKTEDQKDKFQIPHPKSQIQSRIILISIFSFVTLFLVLSFAGKSFWQIERPIAQVRLPQTPGKKPLAVMFFENQSNSAELEWLREGLADMLISNLSRSEKLTLLNRQQLQLLLERSGHKAGEEIHLEKALEIARKSRAEAFIVGSFAKMGEKIRLDAQIYDAQNGGLIAAESLTVDRPEQILTEIDLLSFKLANRLGAAGEPEETRANLAQAMTDNLEAYRYYSLALEKAQGLHSKDALALLEKSVALDPEFAMAHARIGHTYAVTWGWAEKAKPHLERAFALSDRLTEKDRLYITSWYAIANLDYPAAMPPLREIIQKYPAETEAYLRLGYLLRGEEQFEEAIGVMRQGLAIDPESSALYNSLGLLYSVRGRHDEAIAMHERYVALEPAEANACDSLGMSYQWAGRYEEAIAEYNRAVQLNSNFDIARVHLATTYFQTGRYRAAIDEFKKFVAVAPSKMESGLGYSDIAHVYRKQKNLAAAERAAKQAFKENEFYVWEMIAIALERGKRPTAKELEQQIFSESGSNNRGKRETPRYRFYYRGYIALKNGQTDQALENFREALRHPPPTWDIDALEDCLANAYLELERFDEAIAEYQRVLRLNPNYPLARFHLAQAFERKGQTAEARENYRLFLETWKDADADIPEIVSARNSLGG